MMDLETMRRVNGSATRRASRAKVEPTIWNGDRENFKMKFVGDRCPRGWHRTDREDLFCDHSGFGGPGEPALTQDQLIAALKIGFGYGVVESGQFQSYVREFRKGSAQCL
jgi:hypothetical protein